MRTDYHLGNHPLLRRAESLADRLHAIRSSGRLQSQDKMASDQRSALRLTGLLLLFFTPLDKIVNGSIAKFGKPIFKGFPKDALLTTAYGISQGGFSALFVFTGP